MKHRSAAILLQEANHRADTQKRRANFMKKGLIAMFMIAITQAIIIGVILMAWHEEVDLLHSQRSSRSDQIDALKNSVKLQDKENLHLKRLIRYKQFLTTGDPLPPSEEVLAALRAEGERYMNSNDTRLILVEKLEWTEENGAKIRFKNIENGMVKVTRKYPQNSDMTIMMLDPEGKGWWHAATEYIRYPSFKPQDRKPKVEWPEPKFEILPVQSSTKTEFVPKRK